jgi:hypothetical protein
VKKFHPYLRLIARAVLRRLARLDVEVHNDITAQGYSFESLVKHLHADGPVTTAFETGRARFLASKLCPDAIGSTPAPRPRSIHCLAENLQTPDEQVVVLQSPQRNPFLSGLI